MWRAAVFSLNSSRIDYAGPFDIIPRMDTPMCDKNGRLFNGHVDPDTRALLQLVAMSMKDVREGKVKPAEEAFADIRREIENRR